jgi:general secretion pathway protein B
MSYILEALRRADAERERGAVPGLHAQPTIGELEIPATRERRPMALAAAGIGVLVVLIGAVILLGPWRGAPAGDAREAVSAGATPAQVNVPPANATPAGTGPMADAGVPPSPPVPPAQPPQANAAISPLPMATRIAPEVSDQRTPAVGNTITAPGTRGAAPAAADANPAAHAGARAATARGGAGAGNGAEAKAPAGPAASEAAMEGPVEHYGPPLAAATTPAPAPTTAPAPAPAAANPVRKLSELPPNVRATLPNLTVGGAIYSDTPSGRMLILNGQIYHEGEKPAADTVLEQIRLKSAVLNYRGQRYEITY